MLCLTAGALTVALAVQNFTLSWIHSVEKTEIQEDYSLADNRLILTEARIKGSGAGFDPPPGARLSDGWWRWRPGTAIETLTLARAAAPGEWTICIDHVCHALDHYLPDDHGAPAVVAPCSALP